MRAGDDEIVPPAREKFLQHLGGGGNASGSDRFHLDCRWIALPIAPPGVGQIPPVGFGQENALARGSRTSADELSSEPVT
jgi:hypothetical protein